MQSKLKALINPAKPKLELHPRNKHKQRYNFDVLIAANAELAPFVKPNAYADLSIDFFNPLAVKALNKALLKAYYNIEYWDIPDKFLCPPIPGRADYIHYLADLLGALNHGLVPMGPKIKCLDIGVGANCVYPIIGAAEYRWSFVGSDIDPKAVQSAVKIVESNPELKDKIEIRLQKKRENILFGIIEPKEKFEIVLCNPPFHASLEEALGGNMRKNSNLKNAKAPKPALNFGGNGNELWCEGGEIAFIGNYIAQSKQYTTTCLWFTCIVSKQSNLSKVYTELRKAGAATVKTVEMGQGNKVSRFVAWTFLSDPQKNAWFQQKTLGSK